MVNPLGRIGEDEACKFLLNKGYKILSRNFKSLFGEIDIIAREGDTIIFVEVKSRSNFAFGTSLEAITLAKLEKIKKTAYIYLKAGNLASNAMRFDAIEIFKDKSGSFQISHLKNITQ